MACATGRIEMNPSLITLFSLLRIRSIPTGLHHSAQGWPRLCRAVAQRRRERTTLGQRSKIFSNPNGVASFPSRFAGLLQPFQGSCRSLPQPRVARSSRLRFASAPAFASLRRGTRNPGLNDLNPFRIHRARFRKTQRRHFPRSPATTKIFWSAAFTPLHHSPIQALGLLQSVLPTAR
jgi:hypothetical protein